METYIFFILCIFAFISPHSVVTGYKSNSAMNSPTKIPPSRTAVPKSSGDVPTSYLTHRSHMAANSPTGTQKTPPSGRIVPKSSGKVPTVDPTIPTSSPKTSVRPTTATTSNQKQKSSNSRGSGHTSTKTPKSAPLPAATTANRTATQKSTITPTSVSASKTLTVSNGQTVSAQVGWMVVGVGIGGAVAVGDNILPVAAGTEAIIEENSSGGDELSTIESHTSTTTTSSESTSKSRSTSRSSSRSSSSSTSSSTASPTPYNIYPRLDSTPPQQSAVAQHLEQIAQPGSVRSITGGRDQLLLWVASLTPAQASELSRNPVVRGLNVDRPLRINLETGSTSGSPPSGPNCPPENCSHQKRDGSILMQQDARDELKMFSQAKGARSLSALPGYAYDARGGRGITVYVVDTGINPNHPEFRNMQGSIRWLYLPGDPQTQGDNYGHGTCVASKVSSPSFGVAKSANIVIVKVYPRAGTVLTSRIIAAWGVVAKDIATTDMHAKAVVTVAVGVFPDTMTENDRTTYIAAMTDVIEFDAVVVAASGNISPSSPGQAVDSYPARLASQFPIVAVGAVDPSGIYASYSQGLATELTVSAVGRVYCASHRGGATEWQGTSFAAPAVAGLAAYLMSLDQYRVQLQVPGSVARNVRDLIKALAYARLPLQPAVVWNGIDSREIYCPVRRDAGSSGCPARNTTLPIGPPATPKSKPRPPSTATGTSTTSLTSSSSPPTSITMSSTTSSGGESFTSTLTIPLSGSSEIVTISAGGDSVVATNAPKAFASATHHSLQ